MRVVLLGCAVDPQLEGLIRYVLRWPSRKTMARPRFGERAESCLGVLNHDDVVRKEGKRFGEVIPRWSVRAFVETREQCDRVADKLTELVAATNDDIQIDA